MRRLKNTSGLPDEVVRDVVNWIAAVLGIGGFDVECRNCSGTLAGKAYTRGSSYHATSSPFVVLRVGTEYTHPRWPERVKRQHPELIKKRFPTRIQPYQYAQHRGKKRLIASRIEALVYIAAHELRHLWQERRWTDKGRCAKTPYFHGARGKFSEIDTEAFAIHMLREFRKRTNQT